MRNDSGVVLLVVLIVLIGIGAAAAALLTTASADARSLSTEYARAEALQNARAAIDYVRTFVECSRYDHSGRNEWLQNHSSSGGTDLTEAELPELAEVSAMVTITDFGENPWYRLVAVGTSRDGQASRRVEAWAREREPFSEYMFFIGQGTTFGETSVMGRVHANGRLTFNSGSRNPGTNEPAKFWGEVTSTGGHTFNGSGSFEEIFTIYEDDGTVRSITPHSFDVARRELPDFADVDTLYAIGAADGYVAGVSVEFVTGPDGGGNLVTRVSIDGGAERPLPPNGVIAADGDNVVVTGTTTLPGGTVIPHVAGVNGRVTLVNRDHSGRISLDSSIVHIDGAGNPAYHYRSRDGTLNDYRTAGWFADGMKDVWAGAEFRPNPSYSGDSAVGIVAADDVRYGESRPASTSIELDAAIIAKGGFGYWHDNLVKRNLTILGSLTFDESFGRYSGSPRSGKGYSYHGTYQYDGRLRGNGPPHFLGTRRPIFYGWRVIE